VHLEGRGHGLLKPSRNVHVEVEQKSSYAFNSYVLRLKVFGVNSERNLDRGLHRYSELLIFVVFPYVPFLTTNIQTLSNFSLWPVIQNRPFSCYFLPYNDRNSFAEATVYLGFDILL
jgi:hypothetical protein